MKKTKVQKPIKQVEPIKENTIEMEKEIALEGLKKSKNVFDKVVVEGEDKENLTMEDTREVGYELIQNRDEIEEYRP